MKVTCASLTMLLVTVSSALVQGYSVEPVMASWSGWTRTVPGQNYVSEIITCNWDSVVYCELFVGDLGASPGNAFQANVYEVGGGVEPVAWSLDTAASRGHTWLKMPLTTETEYSFTKGKEYEFRFTRVGSDSIHYYLDSTDSYSWGHMEVAGESTGCDLCARVYGLLDPVDSTYWGANVYYLPPTVPSRRQWADSLKGKVDWGVCYVCWDSIQPRFDSLCFASLDTKLACMDTADVEPVACPVRCPKWASTRIDTFYVDTWYINGIPHFDTLVDTCVYCPPRGLWATGDSNYWAVYLKALVDHIDECGWQVHTWEIYNESNEGCTLKPCFPHPWPGYTGWWRRPETHYAVSSDAHDMCSLYVRLCEVAANTIRSIDGHEDDRIIIGAVSRVSESIPWMRKVKGKWWVDTCYQVATRTCTTGVFWDGVSAHPYQYKRGFSEPLLEQDGADMRAVMRAHEHCDGLLWNTELGWS
ncbi:MAG: hypothetical protein JSU73_13560, partial [candidate division WOR-3 bacterium]